MLNDKQIATSLIGLGPATVLMAAGLSSIAGVMLVFTVFLIIMARKG